MVDACILSMKDSGHCRFTFGGGVRERFEGVVRIMPGIVGADSLEARREELERVELILCTWDVEALGEDLIAEFFPRLRALFYIAGSVQSFARPFLARGVRVFSSWGSMAIPVAEFTVALIVLANKGAFLAVDMYRGGDWEGARRFSVEGFPGTYRTKVGILGAGRIGSLVLEMLKAYSVEALLFDPYASEEKAALLGARRADLAEIFRDCQTVSNHLANNASTAGLLDYRLFSLMKPNAAFINTGRGAQVVEADLARALAEEEGRCAFLDVTWPEPCPADHPFRSLPNAYLSPHIAGMGTGDVRLMADHALRDLQLYLSGGSPASEVTLPMLETMA